MEMATAKTLRIEFIKDLNYDSFTKEGKVSKTVKKGVKKELIEVAAKNLIRTGFVKEIN